MTDYNRRLMEWMLEHRYANAAFIRDISPAAFGCTAKVIEKYLIAHVKMGSLVMEGGYIRLRDLERYKDEVFPWEK